MEKLTSEDIRRRHDEEVKELHRQLLEKDQVLESYKKDRGQLDVYLRKVLKEVAQPIQPLKSELSRIKQKASRVDSEIIPVKHITDSHMGAQQRPDEIEGFNEFSPEICDNRNLAFTSAFLAWINLHRELYKIRQACVILTGDLISGDIHDELRVTNAFPSPVQVHRAALIHSRQVALIAPFFESVTVHFIVEDNHARLTKKPQAKEAGYNTLNYLVGSLMEAYLEKHQNVIFHLYPMLEKVIQVGARNYLIRHGHNVRGWMGIPWYGLERSSGREAAIRQNIIMQDARQAKRIGYHKIIQGHFHTPFDTPLYSCGGSVSGTDAYDHKEGRHSEPSQSAWMIHPKYGEFNRVNFQLKHFDKGV
jgi:hypothetical protein